MAGSETRRSTLQQERSRDARRRLARAANALWAENGFDATSVSDICRAAGVPRANFYFYFPSRDDLLLELGLEALESAEGAMADALARPTTDEALRGIAETYARLAEETSKPLLARTILQFMTRTELWVATRAGLPGFHRFVDDLVALADERGELGAGIRQTDVAEVMGAVVRQGLLGWARDQLDSAPLDELLYRRMRMVLNGARRPLR